MYARSRLKQVVAVALAGVALVLVGCTSLVPGIADLGLSLKKGKPFVLAAVEGRYGWGFASHPYMCGTGAYVRVEFNLSGDGGVGDPPPDLQGLSPAVSLDGGANWIFGQNAITSTADRVCWGAILPDGRYLPPPPFRDVSGLTYGSVSSPGLVLDDGRIVFASYGYRDGEEKATTVLLASTNEGASYFLASVIADVKLVPWTGDLRDARSEGPCEPALVHLGGQELLCIMRTGTQTDPSGRGGSRPMLQARSLDGGKTWKYHQMLIGGVMPKLRLLSNGVLVLATGRPGNSLYFSTDGGRSWPREVSISGPSYATSGYCDLQEVTPGRLLVAYDLLSSPIDRFWLWEPKLFNGIMGVYIDVRRRF